MFGYCTIRGSGSRGRDDRVLFQGFGNLFAREERKNFFDDGGADEYSLERGGGEKREVETRLEAFCLAAEVIPVYADVETAN